MTLAIHPEKCSIIPLSQGISLLGFRVFYHYKLVRQRNVRSIESKLATLLEDHRNWLLQAEDVFEVLHGWNAYAMHGNTYKLRKRLWCDACRCCNGISQL